MNTRNGFAFRWPLFAGALIAAALLAPRLAAAEESVSVPVTEKMLIEAQDREDSWLHYARNYAAWRHAPMDEIDRDSVSRLVPKWSFQTGILGGGFEVSAIAHDGRLYITTANSHLICVDAETGEPIWRYDHDLPLGVNLCCGPVNRGVAIRGDKIYYCTLDARLICFDAATGLPLWDREVIDYRDSYSLTVAPLIVGNKVVVGIAGAEYGIRGFIDAYNADTGQRIWRFYTIPAEGEPGSETWEGASWMNGGGSAWVTGSYDPELNLIYWGIGNPSPDFNGDVRMGDNLYTDCVVALNADNGELVWYFQMSPHDVFDWDGVSEPILIDETIGGVEVKALVQANRNGYLYALDRTNGDFLYAKPYTKVNWADLNEDGIPVLREELKGGGRVHVCPGLVGGKNWPPAAYSPSTHMIYIPDIERCTTYTSTDVTFRRGLPYYGGMMVFDGPDQASGSLKAVDTRTGEMQWSFAMDTPNWAGVLTTGGGLVFAGAPDGFVRAFNDETGEVLWEYQTGSGVFAPPTSFTLDGKQYIGLASGWGQTGGDNGPLARAKGSTYYLFGLAEE